MDNRRFALKENYTEFQNSKNFMPLVPEQAACSSVEAAEISREGLHTAQESQKAAVFA